MNHLIEGTIHAWLDGALDAAQAAEIDAHVKSCGECSAKVAEARGLIAASSRILLSLDDTPANVIPKKAPVVARRRWRVAPWMTAAAAALVVITVWKEGGVKQSTPASQIVIPSINVVPSLPEPSLERLKEPAAPPAARRTAPPVAERRQARVANAPQVAASAGAGAVVGAASGTAAGAARDEARRSEPFAAEALQGVRKDATASLADSVLGCYRMPQDFQLAETVVTSANVQAKSAAGAPSVSRARERSAVAAAAPAPAASQKLSDMAQPVSLVRLDTGSVVRVVGSGASIGSWVAIGGDSARVALAGRTSLLSKASKVQCP